MVVALTATASLNGGSIDLTVYEDTNQDGTADASEAASLINGQATYHLDTLAGGTGNDYWIQADFTAADIESTPQLQAATVDTDPTITGKLESDVNLNGGSVSVAVKQDTTGDGSADKTDVVDLADGVNTEDLYSVDVAAGDPHWLDMDLSAADIESAPQVNAITIRGTRIVADVASVSITGRNANTSPGVAAISSDEATLSVQAQNTTFQAGEASIPADAGVITLEGQDAGLAAGEVQIQADTASVQITAQNAGRVFDSTTLSGTVNLNASGVKGATIYCLDTDDQAVAAVTTTDANGDYQVKVDTGDVYHMVVQYEDDQGNQYNDRSKPFLAT